MDTLPASAIIQLPPAQLEGHCSVEKSLAERRSVRKFTREPLSLATLSQLLWAAQGVTRKMDQPHWWTGANWQGGMRTAPSAGALYPIEVYAVAGRVDGLEPGVYKYKPLTHELHVMSTGDKRSQMVTRPPGQNWLADAPCHLVVAAVRDRLETKYGERSSRYILMEVGHVVENICLQAVALGLGGTVVGAFKDEVIKAVVGMPKEEVPLAFVPVGRPNE